MKSMKFWLFVGLLSAPIFIYSQFRADTDWPMEQRVRAANDASWVQLILDKPARRPALVRLVDQSGAVMAYRLVSPTTTEATIRFGLAALPPGTYRLELHDRHLIRANELVLTGKQSARSGRQLLIRNVDPQ
ncbi:hypothetical protein [Fibrella aquatilis]|uniref:Uncharacterized protein n=1 Tax=Fibrella aquatilis TaxID=2817059 RepID=A0A939JYN4_9BACT|nr:hypothetical protein [Fibrella aquatilis]MBO0932289.1 hypothetical protein [Fibrella aquatilis]